MSYIAITVHNFTLCQFIDLHLYVCADVFLVDNVIS